MSTINQFRIDGKVAIVTGGGGAIGEVYGRARGEAGASVELADVNAENAERAAGALVGQGFSADSPHRAAIAAQIPGKKMAPADDLLGALLLLASPAGEWINGQTISVDGGWIMRL